MAGTAQILALSGDDFADDQRVGDHNQQDRDESGDRGEDVLQVDVFVEVRHAVLGGCGQGVGAVEARDEDVLPCAL